MACIKRGVIVIFSVIKVRDSFINFAFNLFRLLIGADSVLYKMSAVLLYYNIVSLFKRKLVAMEIHVDKLNSQCQYRNCQFTKNDYPVSAGNFSEEFKQLGCDISTSNTSIHQKYVTNTKHCYREFDLQKQKGSNLGLILKYLSL